MCCRSCNLGMSHMAGRGAWALVSLAGVAVSCAGAIALPYFDILAAIMGALGNLVAAYALPALFVLVSSRAQHLHCVPWEHARSLCCKHDIFLHTHKSAAACLLSSRLTGSRR